MTTTLWAMVLLALALIHCATPTGVSHSHEQSPTVNTTASRPQYGPQGELLRPNDVETWVFLGSSLNLAYPDSRHEASQDLINHVFMEPSAYAAYQETGGFPEGTMTAIMIYSAKRDTAELPDGLLPGELRAFEVSVKDSKRHPKNGWGFYNFGTESESAQPQPLATCFECHHQHAESEFVFTQYYPIFSPTTKRK